MSCYSDVKHKSKKQQKLCSILRGPRFREQFRMFGNQYKFWDAMSSYLSSNILVIDKLFNEYMKDDLANLKNEIVQLRRNMQWLHIAICAYRNGNGVRDVMIMRLWEMGETKTEIANEVGITRQGVAKALKRLKENQNETKSYYGISE